MDNDIKLPIRIPVSKVSQPIGDFYVGRIDARTLLKISFTEIRKFEDGTQEKIAGIQRERAPNRVEDLRRYVNLEYATFPTSIIIAVPPECAEIEHYCPEIDGEQPKVYTLLLTPFGEPDDEAHIPLHKIAFILDGQHRLAGLEGLDKQREFDVNISVFVGASEADKAEIFARVNQAQTKVNQSLVVDLASYYNERGPVKFAHEIVLAMNKSKDGPLFRKVKRLGKADAGMGRIQTLAQATVVKPIVDYITNDAEGERNKRYKGIFSSRRPSDAWRRFIFQPFFDEDDDSGVYLCLTNYFNAVKARWPASWDNAPTGTILNRTTGYAALMRLLRPVYLAHCSSRQILKREDCNRVFAKIDLSDDDLTKDMFVPGSSGISKLYKKMMSDTDLMDFDVKTQKSLF